MFYNLLELGRYLPHGGHIVLDFQQYISRLSCQFERGGSPERSGGCSSVHVLGARRELIGKGIIILGIFQMIGKTP